MSIWEDEIKAESLSGTFPALSGEVSADVAVVGGGITGLLTAYLLGRKGVRAVVLEAGRIFGGATGGTSAKITAQQGMIYKDIVRHYGAEAAAEYAAHQTAAAKLYDGIIKREGIECGYTPCHTTLFSVESDTEVIEEQRAAEAAGLKYRLTTETGLPFEVVAALTLEGQAVFNPLAFLNALSHRLNIYENSRAIDADGTGVRTANGRVRVDYTVVATHFPFIDSFKDYALHMHQSRGYMLALENAELDGAYLGIDGEQLTLRPYGSGVILGGGGHRTGDNESGGRYARLHELAGKYFPGAAVRSRFSTQDCMTHDNLPYVGEFSKKTGNLFVATGFNKWGMCNAMNAADLISKKITGQISAFPEVFSPRRHSLIPGLGRMLTDGARLAAGLIKENAGIPFARPESVKPGHGGIVMTDEGKRGLYVESAEDMYVTETKCAHKGCELTFNPDEKTWDCPCHGSRYSISGTVLSGPAQDGIASDCRCHSGNKKGDKA